MSEDLRIVTRQAVEAGGVTLRPLPRVLSQHWRLALWERLRPVLTDGTSLTDGAGQVDLAGVGTLAERVVVELPDSVSWLVAHWVTLQALDPDEVRRLRRVPDEIEIDIAETEARLGADLTEADEQDALLAILKLVFPLDRLQQLSGVGKYLEQISTAATG